jgi:hypothetical protein
LARKNGVHFLNFGVHLKLNHHFRPRNLYVVCYYDGRFMRGDKLRAHTACKHDKLPPRALKPGEKPLDAFSSDWEDIAKAMDQRKASSENPKEALSEEIACSLAKPLSK